MSNKIDCDVSCPVFIRVLNSCPTRNIDPYNPSSDDIFELFMVLLSTTPYIISFFLFLSTMYFRTTRCVLVVMMIFIENFLIELFKGALRDPRPNFICNNQFGNPSNHATFFTSLITWIVMEYILLESKLRISYLFPKIILILSFPFIMYSRIYLNYHTFEQILNGIMLGFFIGCVWFVFIVKIVLKTSNPIKRILQKLKLKNNMSNDLLLDLNFDGEMDDLTLQKLMQLSKKHDQLSKIKHDLKKFTSSLEQSEVINKMMNEDFSKKKN